MSLTFTSLEVGSGDAFLLEKEQNGEKWVCLFDSGGSKSRIKSLLNKHGGIKIINLAICSHNDNDHANGFIGLLELKRKKIKEIWLPGIWASILQYIKDEIKKDEQIDLFHKLFDDLVKKEEDVNDLEKLLDNYFKGRELDSLYDKEAEAIDYKTFNNELSFFSGLMDSEGHVHAERIYDSCLFKYSGHCMHCNNLKQCKPQLHNIKIKLDRIIEIAILAYKRECTIRWFEPQEGSAINEIKKDYGFVSLNSTQLGVRKLKDFLCFLQAISLTEENKYSLAFEYCLKDKDKDEDEDEDNGIPIVRFSADSNCTCQSSDPYVNNIIVTAPHHGSAANANVYSRINGNNIIWVRSDRKKSDRPCDAFKKMKNRYCLACYNLYFVKEIRFEYDYLKQQWNYIGGHKCDCK